MVEFNPQGRPRSTDVDDREDTIKRPYAKVDPVNSPSGGERGEACFNPGIGAASSRAREGFSREPVAREEFAREPRDSRSIGDLLRELLNEGRAMLQQELALAKAEVRQNVKSMARHAAMIATGGAVAYAGLLTIIGALALGAFVLLTWAGVATGISLWLGPLIVGVVVAIIGYAMLKSGMDKLKDDDLIPDKTAQSMRENAQWMQDRVK